MERESRQCHGESDSSSTSMCNYDDFVHHSSHDRIYDCTAEYFDQTNTRVFNCIDGSMLSIIKD